MLLVYMPYSNNSQGVIEEFLFAEQLKIDTKVLAIYTTVEYFLTIVILFLQMAATMIRPIIDGRGFFAHLKRFQISFYII